MELANRIAYGGLLRNGRAGHFHGDEQEITIVDTSRLEAGATAERGPGKKGRWWAAGAAISYCIASRHDFKDVGIVTPYRHQALLTQAVFHDRNITAAQIGTAHSFQGREFTNVIVDLLEDGKGSSWVAAANRSGNDWAHTGVRLFNVAVTRNAGRLYLVSKLRAIENSRSGLLQELRKMVESGLVTFWDARSLLVREVGISFSGVSQSFRIAEKPPQLFGDQDFYGQLLSDCIGATNRIVIFSPLVAERRVDRLLPILQDAVTRGIRVTAVTKPASELSQPHVLERLNASGVVVHERPGMHEKVVIIDSGIAYVGSLNTLSNNGQTGEIMLRLNGTKTAMRLEDRMKATMRS